jgi:hypothetical protein
MRKLLSSFNTYIRSRSTKIIDLMSLMQESSLSSYTIVHTTHQNNVGILFQLCPKIQYYLTPTTEYNSIIVVDEYAKHIVSPEELRYLDYSMNMKHKRHGGFALQATINGIPSSRTSFNTLGITNTRTMIPFPLPFQNLHSLPIVYPYDDSK